MDPRDLKAASKYVNNLLASRGLLRGKEIPFHKPTGDNGTPAKIINLVHELLSRRDKEAEEREALALTIRTLRAMETKQADTIADLKSKTTDLIRQNSIFESTSRSSSHTLHASEVVQKTHRDETIRIKTLLSQVRMQCAIDIRKRDIQIEKMKERLSDARPRGQRAQLASCTVINPSSNLGVSLGSAAGGDEETSLIQDTTDFLTKLSQDLADENDNLIALIRTTLSTLKAIQGLPDDDHLLGDEGAPDGHDDEGLVSAPPSSFEDLTAGLDEVIISLKEVLNHPNYVPLEDLAEKETEITRLIAKNEMLEVEWKKAIDLVDGWNKTMSRNFTRIIESRCDAGESTRLEGSPKRVGRTVVDIVKERGMEEEEEMEDGARGVLSMVQEEREEDEDEDKDEEYEAEETREEMEREVEGDIEKEMQGVDERLEQEIEQVEKELEQDEPEVEVVVPQPLKKSPSKKQSKQKSQPAQPTPEPQQSPAKKDNKRKSTNDTPFRHLFQDKEISIKSPAMASKPSARRKSPVTQDSICCEETEEVNEAPAKKDRKRKPMKKDIAPQEVSVVSKSSAKKSVKGKVAKVNFEDGSIRQLVQEGAQATAVPVLELKKGKRNARKSLATEPETFQTEVEETLPVEDVAEALKRKQRKRRPRKGEEREVTVGETTEISALKEIVAGEEALVPAERKLRSSRAKKDAEISEVDLDLFLTKAIRDDIVPEVQLGPKRGARRQGVGAGDTTVGTKTTETTILEDTFQEVSKESERKRCPSHAKRPKNDIMLDELSAEPVPVHYEEIANKAQVVSMCDQDKGDGEKDEGAVKFSRARRRSLRNRDKYHANSVKAQEAVPIVTSPSIAKRKRKRTSAGQTPRKRVARGLDSRLIGDD